MAALASLHQVPDQAAAQTGSVFQQDLIQRGGAKDLSISVSGFHSSHPSPSKTRSKNCLWNCFLGGVVTIVTILTITFTYFHNFSHTLCSFVRACLIDGAIPWRPSSKADLLFKALEFGCNDSHQQVTMQPRLGMSR